MKKLPKIGQRVVIKDNYKEFINSDWDYLEDIIGQTAVVIFVEEGHCHSTLLAFDTAFSDRLHTGSGRADVNKCWWVNHGAIKKLK